MNKNVFRNLDGIIELNPEFAGNLIDVFEDFLDSKGIQIENDEKEGEESEAILYGSDYDEIIQGLTRAIKAWIDPMKPEEISVTTSAGILKAVTSTDPGQPGISVMLQPAGYDCVIDMSYVSVYEDPEYKTSDNERPVDVSIMTYADVYSEDYTSKNLIRREDVLEALKYEKGAV